MKVIGPLSVFALWFLLWAFIGAACNVDGDHDVKVSGGTTNTVTLDESFCDADAYPVATERRACKDALLAAMKCRTAK